MLMSSPARITSSASAHLAHWSVRVCVAVWMRFADCNDTEYVTTRKRVQNALDEVWLTKGHGVLVTAISTAECTACTNAFPYPAQAFGALTARAG